MQKQDLKTGIASFIQKPIGIVAFVNSLAQLTNLDWLVLNNNQIADISPVAQLTNLESLELRNNQITDISFLGELTNLERVDLTKNNVAQPVCPTNYAVTCRF